ncbi:MAG: hypothetical protein ACRER5_02955 [Pseudomonas sp.]
MHGQPRYGRIYEENPVGPALTIEDLYKTAAALEAVLRVLKIAPGLSDKDAQAEIKRIGKEMTAQLRRQWSVFTAMQYLTGQKADKAVIRWEAQFAEAGLSRRQMAALIALANDYCANAVPGKSLSTGLLVEDYKAEPAPPHTALEALGFPDTVLAKVLEQAGRTG